MTKGKLKKKKHLTENLFTVTGVSVHDHHSRKQGRGHTDKVLKKELRICIILQVGDKWREIGPGLDFLKLQSPNPIDAELSADTRSA